MAPTRARARTSRRLLQRTAAALAVLFGGGGTLGLHAQALVDSAAADATSERPEPLDPAGHPIHIDSVLDRVHTIDPVSGPSGTRVALYVGDLPAVTALWLGIGATGSGFEALSFVLSDNRGNVSHHLLVPAWVDRSRSHRFIVFDAYFRPLALTRPFHVTDEEGLLLREGRISQDGRLCAVMEGQDGLSYGLVGSPEVGKMRKGNRVVVEGRVTESTGCGQYTVQVVKLDRAAGGG